MTDVPIPVGKQPRDVPKVTQDERRVQVFLRSVNAINTAWVTAVALAIDLLCWMRLLLLDGPLAKAEPATLRYRLLHAAARLVKRSRYLILRVPETWPWAAEFAAAVNRVRAIP